MDATYDLVVIGAGPAGEKGAAQAAYYGKRVALVDASPRPGGIAVSTAGIPTKTLREGAIYLSGLGQNATGVPHPAVQDAWPLLMARKLDVSEFMTKVVERNLVRHRIERIQGRARLRPGNRVEVEKSDGERFTLKAEVVLIACGSRPRHLPGIPMDDPDVYDSEDIFEIERAPRSLLVVGGGPAGCEFASIFAALGVRVTVVDASTQLLPTLDVEMARVLAESFNSNGIRVIPSASVAAVVRDGTTLAARLADGRTLQVEKILVAAGRQPSFENLGLGETGVEMNSAGWIQADKRYETSIPGVFAAGDVLGPPSLASVAMEQARVAICNAFGFQFKSDVDRFWPAYVFSIPEVAWVGLTEEQARASGLDYAVGRTSFGNNAKALISGFPDGMLKLLFRPSDKGLLGVHIVGELASELIHIGQFVLHQKGTIDHFIDATFAVPTRSEAYKYAAYDGLMRLARHAEQQRAG